MIRVRGYAIEDLIGNITFAEMIWLLLKGELPTRSEAYLLGCALVAAVDHGPHAPSIAIARMAISSGVAINNAVASGVNALGDVHGGAGKQAMDLYATVSERSVQEGISVASAADAEVAERLGRHELIAGFGHRFHPVGPRAPRLLDIVDDAIRHSTVEGTVTATARAVGTSLNRKVGRHVPMNIDGATAVVYGELGFAPDLVRGLFILSRSVGIVAHSWEQSQEGVRVKGPVPKSVGYTYHGPLPRTLAEQRP